MALTQEFVDFFQELEQNNYREWFNANKSRYVDFVKEPFDALTQDVIDLMQKLDPEISVTPKECVFRIYRDVRFSKNKQPYKSHMAAVVGRGGRKDMTWPGLYFQLNHQGVSVGGGCWRPDKQRLYRIREKISREPEAFRKIVDARKFRETFNGIDQSERNKIIPKEFREVGEAVPEVYNKSFHYWRSYEGPERVTDPDLAKFLVGHYKLASAFNDFLIDTI